MSPSTPRNNSQYPTPSPTSAHNNNLGQLLQRSLSQTFVSPPSPQQALAASQQLPNDLAHLFRSDIPVHQAFAPPYSLPSQHISPTLSISSSDLARLINYLPLNNNITSPSSPVTSMPPIAHPPSLPDKPARKARTRKSSAAPRGKPAKRARAASARVAASSRDVGSPGPSDTSALPPSAPFEAGRMDAGVVPTLELIRESVALELQPKEVSSLAASPLDEDCILEAKLPAADVSDHEDNVSCQVQVSWKVAAGPHDMTALDVLILWLTTGENYDRWRRGSCSKKDVGEMVSSFLAQNGHPGRSSAMV